MSPTKILEFIPHNKYINRTDNINVQGSPYLTKCNLFAARDVVNTNI